MLSKQQTSGTALLAAVLLLGALVAAALLAAGCGSGPPEVVVRSTGQPVTATPSDPGSRIPTDPTPDATRVVPVELPAAPQNPVAGGLLVPPYLGGGLADIDGCLPRLVAAWGLGPTDGERCLAGDIDGDDRDELVFVVSTAGERPTPGDVWFFEDASESYRLLSSARAAANAALVGVRLHALVDLTGDQAPEAVITSQMCDPEGCTSHLVVASLHRGFDIEDLAPGDPSLGPDQTLLIADQTEDGLLDLVIERELADNDPEAGPQRSGALVVAWTGLRFRASETSDDPEYLFHLVADADTAFRSGDLDRAIELYLEASQDLQLRDWKQEQGQRAGRLELRPYSLLRAALATQRRGDSTEAMRLLTRAATDHTNSLHGLAAAAYLEVLEAGDSPGAACAATESYLSGLVTYHADIWDYGSANPTHEIGSLCR